jgi:hypothetical protein
LFDGVICGVPAVGDTGTNLPQEGLALVGMAEEPTGMAPAPRRSKRHV